MRIAFSAQGAESDALLDLQFGRCPYFVLIDADETQNRSSDPMIVLPNPGVGAVSGAGIVAAQLMVEQGAQAVVTGSVGPNAMEVFRAAGISLYCVNAQFEGQDTWTVQKALAEFKEGHLSPLAAPTAGKGMSHAERVARRSARIAELQHRARQLRQELAQIFEELDRLEKEQ